MKTISKENVARLPTGSYRRAILLVIFSLQIILSACAFAASAEPLFDAPALEMASDEILLVSTRNVGTVCSSESMRRGLRCQRLVTSPTGQKHWKTADWRRLLSTSGNLPAVVYVHGNRVAPGKDITQGMQVYRSLKAHCKLGGPVRFIIWSWPSAQIPGPIHDYLVKARRTNPAAWQLAWMLDNLPVEAPIALVGYSYGSRVVSGAAHLLAGGRLGQLELIERTHSQRLPMRAALLAAAYDADWIQPGHFYGRSLGQLERLVLATNELDPVMRFYHLSNGRGRMHALGKTGIHQSRALDTRNRRLRKVDFTRDVGRSHSLVDYLAAEGKMNIFWHDLMIPHNPAIAFLSIEQQSETVSQN